MKNESQKSEKLTGIWVLWGCLLIAWVGVAAFFNVTGDQYRLEILESPPEFLRTVLYIVTIITFPMNKLLRHIMIRLNETMPDAGSAKSRYTKTLLLSMLVANSIGGYGVLLYLWGDTINTLYIFAALSGLALWLYRPIPAEYQQISEALELSDEQ